ARSASRSRPWCASSAYSSSLLELAVEVEAYEARRRAAARQRDIDRAGVIDRQRGRLGRGRRAVGLGDARPAQTALVIDDAERGAVIFAGYTDIDAALGRRHEQHAPVGEPAGVGEAELNAVDRAQPIALEVD